MIRILLALSIIIGACLVSSRYSAHHEGKSTFETLYMHIVPSPLVEPGGAGAPAAAMHEPSSQGHAPGEQGTSGAEHGTQVPLLAVPLPGFLAFMDWRGDTHSEHPETVLFNLQIFQVAAVLLVLLFFSGVVRHVRHGGGDRLTRIATGFAQWIRDEMVVPVMGKELGTRFLPYFLSVFFFILMMNLLGLVPFAATATASIFVTGALALSTFAAMLICGMVVQGPIAFWKNLVPHVPALLWPLMFVVELMGLIVKPVALTIRLFANLSGGHMVVLSFMGLIFFFGSEEMWGTAGGFSLAPIAIAFAVFIMIIESFVALVQAYVFTQLSIIFVNASVHPEH
jgi:F-type H+-transporting ATPase subunit a